MSVRPARTARRALVVAAAIAAGACGHIIAPPPPSTAAAVARDTVIAGHPVAVAARAARVLVDNQYLTKRFSGDSTWGYQSTDKIAVRLRYRVRHDSTLVHLELWGPCSATACVTGDAASLLAQIATEEAPPQ